ncbi:MAG TPA: hypothetical protein VMK13_10805 [Streptosporangiaceae bacterium]|nr:hypothetical protein [Streptosporangiaceae bacterium]
MAEAPADREPPGPAEGGQPGPAAGEQRAGEQRAGEQPGPAAGNPPDPSGRGRGRAAGIYGTIITAAVLAAAGPAESIGDVALTVVVTLLVYWIAEQYAELLGEQLHGGHLPSWHAAGAALAATWSMVSASVVPLAVLLLAWLTGASTTLAVNEALVVAVLMLMIYAWLAGRAARLRGWRQLVVTSLAALLGLLMIALKDVVILHLH